MNDRPVLRSFVRSANALLIVMLFACGCATARIDWDSRVGNYTYDQAVLELGPPDKESTLQNGIRVAEWMTRRGYAYSQPSYFLDPYPYYAAPAPPAYFYSPDFFLRLTFGADGRLLSWKRLAR
jgi:hypothetical protein